MKEKKKKTQTQMFTYMHTTLKHLYKGNINGFVP